MGVPSTESIYDKIYNDLRSAFGAGRGVRRKFISAFAKVIAAIARQVYTFAAEVRRDITPLDCTPVMLDRHGLIKLGRVRDTGTAGVYTVSIPASSGAVLVSGALFSANGQQYVCDAGGGEAGGFITAQVRALQSGFAAALTAGDTIRMQEAAPGVQRTATVLDVVVQATDEESIEEYRAKVARQFALQMQGMSRADLRAWGESVVNVQSAYPERRAGSAGEINLYIEAVKTSSTDGLGTPPQTMLDAVRDYIEPNIEPLGAGEIYYLPIRVMLVIVKYTGSPTSGDLAAAVVAAEEYLNNIRPFVGGADAQGQEFKGLIRNSIMNAVIVNAAPSGFSSVMIEIDGVPQLEYNCAINEIPYLASLQEA
jgi:uncharacterized phage protein gp47/JayE